MAYKSGFYEGQIGAKIMLDTQDDPLLLAVATVKKIYCKRPKSAVVIEWDAELEGTYLTFTTSAATDLPRSGTYKLQAHLEGPGWDLDGDVVSLIVGKSLA